MSFLVSIAAGLIVWVITGSQSISDPVLALGLSLLAVVVTFAAALLLSRKASRKRTSHIASNLHSRNGSISVTNVDVGSSKATRPDVASHLRAKGDIHIDEIRNQ